MCWGLMWFGSDDVSFALKDDKEMPWLAKHLWPSNHIQKIFFPSFSIPEFNSNYNWCPMTNKPNSSELEETPMCVNTTARAELNYRHIVVADMVHRYNMTLNPSRNCQPLRNGWWQLRIMGPRDSKQTISLQVLKSLSNCRKQRFNEFEVEEWSQRWISWVVHVAFSKLYF